MGKKQKFFLISLIIFLGAFLRFYRIQETAIFLGDQGRDLIEVRESLLAGKIPLAGPLSNEGVRAGPAYYYLIIPPLIISRFHPLGPIILITLLGVINIYLIYFLSSRFFGTFPSILVTCLYAASPEIIRQSIGLWNPIPIPFFNLLILLSLYRIQKERKLAWFVPLGLFLSFAIQLYMPAVFLLWPIATWFLCLFLKESSREKRSDYIKWLFAAGLVFFICLLPFLIFQWQNQFADLKNFLLFFMEKFFSKPPQADKINPSLRTSFTIFNLLFNYFIPQGPKALANLASVFGLTALFLPFFKKRKDNFWHKYLVFWFSSGLAFLIFYQKVILNPHYASFLWPLPFLLFASLASCFAQKWLKKFFFALTLSLVIFNLSHYFKNFPVANSLDQAETIANSIIDMSKNQPFSIVLLSDLSTSDAHLRYILKLKGAKIESVKDGSASQLFVICTKNICPIPEFLQNQQIAETECLPVCPKISEQKTVNLKNWRLLSNEKFPWGEVFFFQNPHKNS